MLADLQQQFLAAFNDDSRQQDFISHLRPNGRLSALEMFAVYQDSITERLIATLRETYPVCDRLVGKDFFNMMACHFISNTPCHRDSLFDYGETFVDFVRQFKPAASLIYLVDVVKLEWAWHQAYYSPDSSDPILLVFNYPIHRIWQVNQKNYHGDQRVHLKPCEERLLVYRFSTQVVIEKLSCDR